MSDTRIERDSMGEMAVPAEALYGASTQRAVLNFPVSHRPVDPLMIHAYGLIKLAAARTNGELGVVDSAKTAIIEKAAREVFEGQHDAHFPVDTYQTGSGTSTNMNANEVIANRAKQLAPDCGVHPNDHVNQSQSSNDTFPTAMHIATGTALKDLLIPALEGLHKSLVQKAHEFHDVLKIGRTHLMDATPVRLGQEFGGFAKQVERSLDRAHKALNALFELPLGGTAVGTGLNCHPDFPKRAIALIAEETGLDFVEAEDHFEAQAAKDALVEVHGQLNTIATSLYKIANDIRLLGSGPRCSIGEISLPSTQPGSSIMPGKVNPVMSEAVTMVAARVFGNHNTVTWAGANGHFELNVFMPVMIDAVLQSIRLLANGATIFDEKCVQGIVANKERCESLIENSLSMVTSLAPIIGYEPASKIAKESVETGRTVRELCAERLDELGITAEQLAEALDPAKMAGE
ncbi:class II fumarate hydratase [Roseibacillus ishigakijimensis]|uniref:Fumarate hydratase class II n=1 Tax=Roseibacillus ishigakijimensis TaxID=454146 RepID=A0A934VM59_9BACT|nr:class II fumarate hydratase [Roseibacillus ishigakijimensis]MBK1833615.1 class II fumarate hydratase [Roseibacillus ishigakijimensis]